MLEITTVNLSPDNAAADARHGTVERGETQPEVLAALLEKLQAVDPRQNHRHEPRILVRTALEKFVVRNSGGRLVLYDARDTTQPGATLDIDGILRAVGGAPLSAAGAERPGETPGEPTVSPGRRLSPRAALAVVLLALGLGLNGWSVYAFLRGGRVPAAPEYAPVTDPDEIARIRTQVAGTYVTGTQSGDRAIVITPDLGVIFREFGPSAEKTPAVRFQQTDTCKLGRRNGALCLVTVRYGLIDMQADGSLRYFGDSYHRANP